MMPDIEARSGEPEPVSLASWPKVAIIILNWNGWQDTIECLKSVYQINYANYAVVLIDNGSTDDSVEQIIEWSNYRFSVKVESTSFNQNAGYVQVIVNSEAGPGRCSVVRRGTPS